MNIPVFILSTTAIGVLCSLPSLGVGYWLRKKGYISFYSPFYIALLCICVLAWIRLAAPKATLLAIACYITILFPVIYSRELWFSDRWRKWWWRRNKSEDEDKNSQPICIEVVSTKMKKAYAHILDSISFLRLKYSRYLYLEFQESNSELHTGGSGQCASVDRRERSYYPNPKLLTLWRGVGE